MRPGEWLDRLSRLGGDVAAGGQDAVVGAARRDLDGFRVAGHRVSMRRERIRVSGPVAPAVAAELARRAGASGVAGLRDLLDGAK